MGLRHAMRKSRLIRVAFLALAVGGGTTVHASSLSDPCDASLTRGIPARSERALGGHAFGERIRHLPDEERELQIAQELQSGNIPDFLRHLVPVHLQSRVASGGTVDVTLCAAPDYLAIGSDRDFILMPMRLATALATAAEFGFTLPTPRLVDAIFAQAGAHLVPQPLPAGPEMRSTDYTMHHNQLVLTQRASLGVPLGTLVAGDKKDLVLTNRLRAHLDRVAIYGWHEPDGRAIQPLSTLHGSRYADYSHGVRLISTQVFIEGKRKSIFGLMQDERLAGVLSSEGTIVRARELVERLATPSLVPRYLHASAR